MLKRHVSCARDSGGVCLAITVRKETAMFQEHQESAQTDGSGVTAADRLSRELVALLGNEAVAQDMTAIVDTHTSFKGVIRYDGTVRIDGRVEGEIYTNGVLLVGKDAVIRARVSAGTIVSCGRIIGEVTATEKVSLLAPAILKGSVKTPLLSMEEGVRLIGTTDMPDDQEESPDSLYVPDRDIAEVANS
jgi:cytoskeletal protein CcmA (bactofilin family)